ncbi:MAG TPA: hypothetical protein VFV38_31215 [Ktedonobacteraceae bacterium]|nr:hypothetical protein [Ktedonobacteraceae bacterium]
MQQTYCTAQRLYPVVLPILLDRRHPTNLPAQRVVVPICRRGVSTPHR